MSNEADSDAMVMPAPAGPVSNANATRQVNHEKSVIDQG